MVEEKVDEILNKSAVEIGAMAKEKGLNPSDYHNVEGLAKAIVGKPIEEKVEEKPEEPKEPEEPEEPEEKTD